NLGELTITRVVIRGNNGNSQGGITSLGEFFVIDPSTKLTMSDSAVIENEGGFFSGGLFLGGTATIVNSTIARNSGRFAGGTFGGGITIFGSLRIISSTVAENRADRGGAGIHNGGGTVELQNTI